MRSELCLELWLHAVVSSVQSWGCGLETRLRKISRSLIFEVRGQSAKSTKIVRLENLALYGNVTITNEANGKTTLYSHVGERNIATVMTCNHLGSVTDPT